MHYWLPKKYYFINELDTNTIKKCDHNTAIIYRNYNSQIIDIVKILNLKKIKLINISSFAGISYFE